MILLFLAACFLAYSNGANDNFKGVASLYGSKTASYNVALAWATFTTFLAQALLAKFSGKGLVPTGIVLSWIITLPCAALISAVAYWIIIRL